jgi:hypothetical protein
MTLRLIGLMFIGGYILTAATPALATTIHASKTGTITIKGEGNQELTTPAGKVVCTALAGSTPITQTELPSLTSLLTLSKCEGFGTTVTITKGEMLLDANGSIRFPNTDKFVITSAVGKCSVLIQSESETVVSLLGTNKLSNNASGTLGDIFHFNGIIAVPDGTFVHSICGTSKLAVPATYEGAAVTSLAGGTLKVE